jgi:hypothetical protein
MLLTAIYLYCTFMGIGILTFLSVRYNQCIFDAERELLLAIRRDKQNAQKEAELRTQNPEPSEEPQEQKEEEIATENPHNQSHELAFEPHELVSESHDPLPPDTETPPSSSKRVKTPLSYKQKWNWEFDGIITEKSIDSKHQSINITNPKIPKTPRKTKSRWSNLKSNVKSIIRKYVPSMSPTKDKP